MKKLAAIAFTMCLLGGCAWLGFGDDSSESSAATSESAAASEAAANGQAAPEEPAAAEKPVAKAEKSAAKTAKGAKSEAKIKAELDAMGKKIAGQASRTLLPNKANKQVKQAGNEWVATYLQVNPNEVTTEMKHGSTGYVGIIQYKEHRFECRGTSKSAALAAPCSEAGARNVRELIRYDGKAWQD